MKIKLIFDISVIGLTLSYENAKTGVYRVIDELHEKLVNSKDLDIFYSHTGFPMFHSFSQQYLKKRGLSERICTSLKYHLPRNIKGRAERYFNKFYQLIKIDLNKLVFNEEHFNGPAVFHTPFTKIPSELKEFKNLKRVITIYDLIPVLYPDYFETPIYGEMVGTLNSIGNDYAICISHSTRNDLLLYDKSLNPENIFVVHLAADPKKFYPCNNLLKFQEVKKKYNIPDTYFLSLCTLEPRKNLDHLIRSFIRFIKEQNISDLKLVLVGAEGWKFESIYGSIKESEKYRDKIVITGRVPDEDLASIYSHAHSFYYMSLYEGFGLPPLEAMQCGVATVTSNVSSLPEVIGEGGIMIAPNDEDELINVMNQLYLNESLRKEYSLKAMEQSKLFSWEKCANEHIEIYKKIVGTR